MVRTDTVRHMSAQLHVLLEMSFSTHSDRLQVATLGDEKPWVISPCATTDLFLITGKDKSPVSEVLERLVHLVLLCFSIWAQRALLQGQGMEP